MNVFVSHSVIDNELIKNIEIALEHTGINLIVAEHHLDLYKSITEKIKEQIRSSDFALILLTENGFNSNFVQQEIGFIDSLDKPYIQLVQKGLEKKITGFNFGRDFISYDPELPEKAIKLITKRMQEFLNQKIKAHSIRQEKIKIKQENQRLGIGIVILASLLLLALILSD